MLKKNNIEKSNISSKKSYTYFLEKASNLLYNLLVGEGDARSRLRENELLVLFVLHLDIPTELESKQKEILLQLSKKEASKFHEKIIASSFQNSISIMRNSTASKIITQLNALYFETKSYKPYRYF